MNHPSVQRACKEWTRANVKLQYAKNKYTIEETGELEKQGRIGKPKLSNKFNIEQIFYFKGKMLTI